MAIRWMVAVIMAAVWLHTDIRAEAQDGPYLLRPGDTLRITVREDPDLNTTALLAPDGRISVPIVGSVKASGRSTEQVRRILMRGLSGAFAIEPTVTVALTALGEGRAEGEEAPTSLALYVLGEVNRPGRFDVLEEDEITVLQLLTLAGGFNAFAAEKRIKIVRAGEETEQIIFNYEDVVEGVGFENNIVLSDGDMIIVPERNLFE